ncbi:MAG: hypothetical protein IE916_02740 [Epsilonproteobacteria bacterium]|nr:hypothetical protein [Campylobacterota bacterium]
MKNEHNICHYCGGRLYALANSHAKCSRCAKKYSLKKAAFDEAVIEGFCQNKSANELAKELEVTYAKVFERYRRLRLLIMQSFNEDISKAKEFEEYIYIPNKRAGQSKEAFNFITFCIDQKVYNYLLPSLKRFYGEEADRGINSFMRRSHIAKLSHAKNTITDFWEFFESFMKHFKGVEAEKFAFYLKEAEFKFNYPQDRRITLLRSLWFVK